MPTVKEIITERICALLEEGIIPWERPTIVGDNAPKGYEMAPGQHYTGINRLLLPLPGEYLTEKMAQKYGGSVIDRSRYFIATFFKAMPARDNGEEEDEETTENGRIVLRYYRVYHISNVEGVRSRLQARPDEAVRRHEGADTLAMRLCREYGVDLVHDTVCSEPRIDNETGTLYIPAINEYVNDESYYSELFRTIARHAFVNGHRDGDRLADEPIADLTAEVSAAMLMAHCGLDFGKVERNTAAYIQKCLNALRADARLICAAAREAEKIAGRMLAEQEEERERPQGLRQVA